MRCANALNDMYKPSDKLLGVWVTTPLLSKKGAITGYDTRLEAVIDGDYIPTTYEFHDSYRRHLGHPLSTDYNGNGLHNLTKVEIKPVWIGWTNDGGKTFMTDEGMKRKHGFRALGPVLKDLGYVPGLTVSKTLLQ